MVDWTKGIIIQTNKNPKSHSPRNNYSEFTASENSEIHSKEEKIKI